MKNGTRYAKRVKQLFNKLRSAHGTPEVPEPTHPVEQLLLGILSEGTSNTRAVRALKALREQMVDYNEIRVSSADEIVTAIGHHVPNARQRADAMRKALNNLFIKRHEVDLEHLHALGRREARQFLEGLAGVSPSAAASVMLWSLGGHAIPVDERMFRAMQRADLVDPSATIDEVQAFLERNVNAADAKVFCLVMEKWVSAKGPRVTAERKKSTGKSGSRRKRKAKATAKASRRTAARSKTSATRRGGQNKKTRRARSADKA